MGNKARYHGRCLRKIFGTNWLPAIRFNVADMPSLVQEAKGHISISGVQMKLSVRLNEETRELESVPTGGTHILKPEPDRFPQIPQNENLCMNIAEAMGMRVPAHGLFPMEDGKLCYVVKRFDRAEDGAKIPNETMFQILGSTNKYEGSLEQIGKAIREHAPNVGLDMVDLFERALLCFFTGNGDMHLKNWALLGRGADMRLAPVYDFVSSRLYLRGEEDSALTINAKRNGLERSDFEALAKHLKIDQVAAANTFGKFRRAEEMLRKKAVSSALGPELKRDFDGIIESRYQRLY